MKEVQKLPSYFCPPFPVPPAPHLLDLYVWDSDFYQENTAWHLLAFLLQEIWERSETELKHDEYQDYKNLENYIL